MSDLIDPTYLIVRDGKGEGLSADEIAAAEKRQKELDDLDSRRVELQKVLRDG